MAGRRPTKAEPEGRGSPVELVDRWVTVETRELGAEVDHGTQRAMAGSPPKKNFLGKLFISGGRSGGVDAGGRSGGAEVRGSGEPDGTSRARGGRTEPAGVLGSRTEPAGALGSRTEPAGALGSRTEPAGALGSWTEPAGALEDAGEEQAREDAGEEQAPEGAGEERVLESLKPPQGWMGPAGTTERGHLVLQLSLPVN